MLVEGWNRQQQIWDFRFYKLIKAQHLAATAFSGKAIHTQPGDLFPSLKVLDRGEDAQVDEDMDPEQSHRNMMATLSRFIVR